MQHFWKLSRLMNYFAIYYFTLPSINKISLHGKKKCRCSLICWHRIYLGCGKSSGVRQVDPFRAYVKCIDSRNTIFGHLSINKISQCFNHLLHLFSHATIIGRFVKRSKHTFLRTLPHMLC